MSGPVDPHGHDHDHDHDHGHRPRRRAALLASTVGALCGLGSAVLFGASAPLAKRLLPVASPLVLSGLLYLGAGLALAIIQLLRPRRAGPATAAAAGRAEAPLRREDVAPLLGILIIGGLIAPWLMLTGLARVSGMSGALLLNLEAPFTMLLAVLVFREHLGRHAAVACALVVTGGVLLAQPVGQQPLLPGDGLGALCIAGACLGWGIDNNLSQRLSLKIPLQVVLWKTLGAGSLSLTLAAIVGLPFPGARSIGHALTLGALSYGVSLLLDMHALRVLGAAREAAYFATAPFIGALLAVPVLGERPGALQLLSGVVMIAGVTLLAREKHNHLHTHEPIEHEHLHVHDEHHQHAHSGAGPGAETTAAAAAGEPHSHRHRHDPITHEHPHLPDLHHRHKH